MLHTFPVLLISFCSAVLIVCDAFADPFTIPKWAVVFTASLFLLVGNVWKCQAVPWSREESRWGIALLGALLAALCLGGFPIEAALLKLICFFVLMLFFGQFSGTLPKTFFWANAMATAIVLFIAVIDLITLD